MTLTWQFPSSLLKEDRKGITVSPGNGARARPLNNKERKGREVLWLGDKKGQKTKSLIVENQKKESCLKEHGEA